MGIRRASLSAAAIALVTALIFPAQALADQEQPTIEESGNSTEVAAHATSGAGLATDEAADGEEAIDVDEATEVDGSADGVADVDGSGDASEYSEGSTLEEPAAAASESAVPQTMAAGTAVAATIEPFASGETRLEGANRYRTAITVSARFSPGVPALYVATGDNFPDALSAAAAAASDGAPLLLTEKNALPSYVAKEIKRLKPAKIYVVGGEGVVSRTVFNQLGTIAKTQRLFGGNRYSTGLDVVNVVFGKKKASFAVIATGHSFPDALASTSVAGMYQGPVILVDGTKSSLDRATRETLTALGVDSVLVVGGTGVVSTGIENQLKSAGYSVKRQGGKDRYETAAKINSAYFGSGSASHYFLATGQNFPDALAGAALAGQLGMPLYVTQQNCMPQSVKTSLNGLGTSNRVVLGGTGAVSSKSANGTVCAAPAPKKVTPKPNPKPSGSVAPRGDWSCPATHPIKGNRSSMIYHMPGKRFYDRTNPEECFATAADAERAGYRASKV